MTVHNEENHKDGKQHSLQVKEHAKCRVTTNKTLSEFEQAPRTWISSQNTPDRKLLKSSSTLAYNQFYSEPHPSLQQQLYGNTKQVFA